MVRSKEELVKSIHAPLTIATIMLYSFGVIFIILFNLLFFGENKLIDYIMMTIFALVFLFIPAIIVQIIRRKYRRKHADIYKNKVLFLVERRKL